MKLWVAFLLVMAVAAWLLGRMGVPEILALPILAVALVMGSVAIFAAEDKQEQEKKENSPVGQILKKAREELAKRAQEQPPAENE